MIIKIDKSKIVEHCKVKFAECLEREDFESAIDWLFKFHEETGDPDFHLPLGMLYLQMTAQSDDAELFTMAFREFLLHLRRHPDCSAAYRDLLATVFLYHEQLPMLECGKWILSRGQALDDILCDLDAAGIDFFDTPDYTFMELEELFDAGEYGKIDPVQPETEPVERADIADADAELAEQKPARRGPSIIPFSDIADVAATQTEHARAQGGAKPDKGDKVCADEKSEKILRPSFGGGNDISDFFNDLIDKYKSDGEKSDDEEPEELLDRILSGLTADDGDDEDDEPITAEEFEKLLTEEKDGEDLSISESMADGFRDVKLSDGTRDHIVQAERLRSEGNIRAAMAELDKIPHNLPPELEYNVSVMRGYFCTDSGEYDRAERELMHALDVKPHGALASTALCGLYEAEKKTERIPHVLRSIDVKDFADGSHVYKTFLYALDYCESDEAVKFTKSLIDEYNIMDMRRMYAQMLYNRGEHDYARSELYKLSRIFYDDINALYYYLVSRMKVKNMPVEEEAPQQILSTVVEGIIGVAENNSSVLVKLIKEDKLFALGVEFFFSLEFVNDRALLIRMFDTVRTFARIKELDDVVRDELVSPYVEPIVKAVIVAELYAADRDQTLLIETGYCPWTYEGDPFDKRYSQGFYTAYAAFMMLKRRRHDMDEFFKVAEHVRAHTDGIKCEQSAIAYYVFKKAWNTVKHVGEPDERVIYALGFKTKTEATKAYKLIDGYVVGKK